MAKEENQAQMAADVLRRNDEFLASKFGEQGVRPISSIDDLISLGLATDDKTLTPEGQRYKALVDKGFINKDGSKTTNGEALSIDINDLTDPTQFIETGEIDEKRADLYDIARKLGRFKEPEKPISQVFGELKEGVSALGKGAYSFIVNPEVKKGETAVEAAQRDVVKMYEAADSIIENLVVGASKTARFLDKQLSFDNQLAKLDLLPEELKQDQVKAEKRKNFRVALIEKAHKDKTALDLAEAIGTADEFVKAKESTIGQYVSQYGEQEGQKKYEEDVSNVRAAAAIPADVPGALVAAGTVGLGAGISLIKNADKARKISQGMSILSHGQELNTARTAVAATAAKLADEASIVSGQLDDALRIGATEKAAELTTKLDSLTAQSQAVQTRLGVIDDGIENVSKTANKLEIGLETTQEAKDLARLAASRTTGALSSGAESLGNGIAKFNGFLSRVERKISRGKIPWIISTALAIPFGKALGGYVAGRLGLLASVPVLRKMGNFGRVMSEEMLERTSSTPFFRRVAANESIGGIGRAVATLGDYSTPLAKGFASMAKGTAQAAPATFSYNAINSQGVDENTLKYAARDALVFGSLGRVLGGKKDMEKVNIDQMTNYRNKLDADQIAVFDGLKDRDFRYALSGIDAAYPGMFKWDIKTTGNNLFDPGNRRAVVNIDDKVGFLKEVAMHEAGHMIQHVWQKDSAIVARMLGDNTQPGLVRNPDGTLDPEFKAWADEYNNLREQNDMTPAALDELAVEYYTDQGVRTLLEDTLKGNLYKESRKTPLRRSVEGSFKTLFNATPIVKNLHFKMGGATDAGGRMVMGTGLLADGFRELPEVKAMVRQMYRETAGKPKAARAQKVVDVKSDNPKHYQATSVLDQVNKQIVERGEKLPDGVLIPDRNGNGEGILTDDHLKALEEAGVIDNGEFGKALLLQSEIEVPTKHGTLLVNKPIGQGRSEQFGGLTENYVVPTKWILKKGRLYLESMDLRQLDKNVDRAVKNKIAKELNLTRKKIYEDIEKSVEIQNRGQSTDAYYKSVDPKNWQRRKNFINSVLGQQTTRQLGINPMMKDVSPDLVSGIYRTFAFDRIQSAIKTTGDVVIPFGPTSYYSLRDNLMPQSPRFNRNGELIYENKKQEASRLPSKQGVAINQQATVQAQEGVTQRQGQSQEKQVRLMPQGKPKATRLASELAKRSKVPLSKVQGSGAGGSITPNDIRAYISEQEGKFKPLGFQKEPPMAVDPTISDLVGSDVEFQGRVGTIVDDGGRPVLQDADGVVYELPFGYFTDQSSRQLGVRPTGKRVVDKNNLIKEFEETSRQELRDIFGYIDDTTDRIVDIAELGNSVKRSKNRKPEIVRETPEFQQYVRGVTDQQILQAWDRTEKALNRAKQSKNINNEDIKAIIDKLEGDIRNIEKLAEAIDVLKQQRISRPSTGQEATTAVSGTSQADLTAQMEAEARAAGAKRRASSIGEPSRRLATPSISESYRRTGKEYRNPTLARSISFAISGQSREREQTK